MRFFHGFGFFFGIKSNETYAWGNNNFGELGLGHNDNITEPQLLICPDGGHWTKFICGLTHTVGITSLENVYTWGSNEFGQLGLGTDKYFYNTPQLLSPPDKDSWYKFSCGGEVTFALTLCGEIYSWGFNRNGDLGLSSKKDVRTPTRLTLPTTDPIKDMQCGSHHMVMLTENGKMFTCGSSFYGELGIGDVKSSKLREVKPVQNTVWTKIFVNKSHMIAINSIGKAYVWGWNYSGQLGLGDNKNRNIPHRLVSPDGSQWDTFFCSTHNTVGKTSKGNVYIWGKNESGMLGLGDKKDRNTPQLLAPIKSDSWKDFYFLTLETIATTASGKVYQWGYVGPPYEFWHDIYKPKDFKLRPQLMGVPYIGLETPKQSKLEYTNDIINEYPVHSSLVLLRCPILMDASLDIPYQVMINLLDIIHGIEISCSIDVLFEMYQFTKQHSLVDIETEIYNMFLGRMKGEDLFQILKVADQTRSEKLLQNSLTHVGIFTKHISDEEWENRLEDLQISSRTIIRATKIRESSNSFSLSRLDVKPFSHYIKQILDSGIGSDFTITLHEKEFHVHRFALAPKNEFFKTLFDSSFDSKKLDLSETPLSISALQNLLEFFYCDTVTKFDLIQCYEIMMVKEYLCLAEDYKLISACEREIETGMSVENCVQVLKLGIRWNQQDIKRVALIFMFTNFQSIERYYKKSQDWDDKLYDLFASLSK